jgi:hypothetical protein
MGRVKVKASL